MKTLEILIVAFALLLARCTVESGTEPINTNTADGKVKMTGTGTGGEIKPFDFGDVHTAGLLLEELADVLLTSPSDTQVLAYDSGDGKWKNVDAGGGSGAHPHSVTLVVDGAGFELTSGIKNPVKTPYGGALVGWTLMGKPSGSVTLDILRAANNVGLPVTSMVGAGTKPALSSAVENSSETFTSWTSTTLFEKDNLAISLSGITTVTYVELTLYFE